MKFLNTTLVTCDVKHLVSVIKGKNEQYIVWPYPTVSSPACGQKVIYIVRNLMSWKMAAAKQQSQEYCLE